MLTPEQIEGLQVAAGRVADPVVEYLLHDIARRIQDAGGMTSTASYQAWRAEVLGKDMKDLEKELARRLETSREEAAGLLKQAAEFGYELDAAQNPGALLPFEENASMQQLISAAVALAGEELQNITQTTAIGMVDAAGKLVPLADAYQSCTDFAFQQVFTGAVDYNTAIRQACAGIVKHGVQVTYAGGMHTTIEAAVRRNIMSGLGLMVEQIEQKNHDDLGCDGWEISAHANSAPDHEPIQGRQYTDQEYESLNNSLVRRIGTLNCGHVASPIILGVDSPQFTPEQLEKFRSDNEKGVDFNGRHYTGYEATQKQRQIERAIRYQQRRTLLAAPEDAEAASIKLQRLRQEYRRFSKGVGLRTEDERLHVAGFGWKEGNKAAAVAEQYYQKWSKRIGANPPIKTLAKYYDVKYDDSPRYTLLKQYAKDVQSGWITPLSGFNNYETLYGRIQSEIVGRFTENGIEIKGQVPHFMQRVIGTAVDPEKLKTDLKVIRRSGVKIEDIKSALFTPEKIDPVQVRNNGKRSVRFIGEDCVVTVNPDSGELIQTNQRRKSSV